MSDAEKALCAMSGGVDSSVAALLLLEQGYEVSGVTMELFDAKAASFALPDACSSASNLQDAEAVCERLRIPHHALAVQNRFRTCVMDQFCASYLQGRTPNPCINCNRYLKFEELQRFRREKAMDYVATGHYARRAHDPDTRTWQLCRAKDHAKDQSYVLYHLTQDDLAHSLFPLGELEKHEVRALAHAHGFVNAEKPESQDICFIPDGDYASFIERWVPDAKASPLFMPGDIVDEDGKRLGRHRGLIHYTIGQRKGIGVAHPVPLYVKGKDLAANQLVVAPREGLLATEVRLSDVNVVSGDWRPRTMTVQVKLSYRQEPVEAELELQSGREAVIRLEAPHVRPAAGQSAVAYDGEVVIGGGTVID